MRLSGSFWSDPFDLFSFLVCATEFLETKSLARLSDYDTTRGYVNGNFIWRYIIGSQQVTFPVLICLQCLTVQLYTALLLLSLLLRLGIHMDT